MSKNNLKELPNIVSVNFYSRSNPFEIDPKYYQYFSPFDHERGDIVIIKVSGVPRAAIVMECEEFYESSLLASKFIYSATNEISDLEFLKYKEKFYETRRKMKEGRKKSKLVSKLEQDLERLELIQCAFGSKIKKLKEELNAISSC